MSGANPAGPPPALPDSLQAILKAIKAPNPSEISREPDNATQLNLLKAKQTQAELESYQQDTRERKRYALAFFVLCCVWIGVITTILLLQGFGSFWFGKMPFRLSEAVILAAIGSTTVNIIGILFVVANYLFPKRGPTEKS